MKILFTANTFKKDVKRAASRGKQLKKFQAVVDLLLQDQPLPLRCRPHKLAGDYAGLWECHIEPDWLLIYDITATEIRLYRMGTHSDLFD